tara:strand:- start:9 stop:182 length:174 start_codon:yes stop_codon:yes gene_type:complete
VLLCEGAAPEVVSVAVDFIDLGVQRWIIISMMVLCNANAIMEYDGRRRLGFPNATAV